MASFSMFHIVFTSIMTNISREFLELKKKSLKTSNKNQTLCNDDNALLFKEFIFAHILRLAENTSTSP